MVTKTVVHFDIPASDMERLSKFYSDVFGWKFQKTPPMGGMDYWLISTGPSGRSIGGGMYKRENAEDRPRNFIAVEEIDASIGAFVDAGGRELVGKQEVPGYGWTFIGTDPDGNQVGLFQAMASGRRARRAGRRAGRRGRSKS